MYFNMQPALKCIVLSGFVLLCYTAASSTAACLLALDVMLPGTQTYVAKGARQAGGVEKGPKRG